ncbi:MAG: hypothetical protein JXM72_09210 [Deltaproteobacteria bacterium]|nr:hypothetical protein [Deltaproteobacteria bacterium]
MKIDPNMIIGAVAPKTTQPGPGTAPGGFEDILRDIQDTGTKEVSPLAAMPQINNINPLKIEVLTMSENAIDMLDTYSKALVDPGNTLKSIAPMVDDLDAMRSKLGDAGSFLSDDDPLKGIVDEVATTISGEILRFRRGDLIG